MRPQNRYIHLTAKDSDSDSDNVESDAESSAESKAELNNAGSKAGTNAESNASANKLCERLRRSQQLTKLLPIPDLNNTCTSAQDGRQRRPCS